MRFEATDVCLRQLALHENIQVHGVAAATIGGNHTAAPGFSLYLVEHLDGFGPLLVLRVVHRYGCVCPLDVAVHPLHVESQRPGNLRSRDTQDIQLDDFVADFVRYFGFTHKGLLVN
jgi:hypothetical protein